MLLVQRLLVIAALALAAATVVGCSERALVYRPPPDAPDDAPPGATPSGPRPEAERCNGIDDDLDGRIDEGCPIRLTRDPADDVSPEIDGNRVAWVRAGALWIAELPEWHERKVADGFEPGFAFDGQRAVTRAGDH